MVKQQLEKSLTKEQKTKMNSFHFLGFNFLFSVGYIIRPVTDDQFSKIGNLGKLVNDLSNLKKVSTEKGIIIPKRLPDKFSNGWKESEILGLSLMMPSCRTYDKIDAKERNLNLIERESLSENDLVFLSKVGFVIKEIQMLQGALKKPISKTFSSAPAQIHKTEKEPLRSWEKGLYQSTKSRPW